MTKSIWNNKVFKEYGALKNDILVDNLVIGGGIAGILTAYFLFNNGKDVCIIEKNRLCSGVTSCTTAHISVLQDFVYQEILRKHDFEYCKEYYESQTEALELYNTLTKDICCDYRIVKSYLYGNNELDKIKNEFFILKNLDASVYFVNDTFIFNDKVRGYLCLFNQATFNPLLFLSSIIKNIEVYENTKAEYIDIKNNIVYANGYKIQAKNIILATNYPIKNTLGSLLKLSKSTTYALAFKSKKSIDLYNDDLMEGFTARSDDGRIIVGGLDHKTGSSKSKYKKDQLIRFANKNFNYVTDSVFTSSCDTVTIDSIPYASLLKNNTYIITGFNKWGMTNAMICAKTISELIINGHSKYEKLFSIKRNVNILSNINIDLMNIVPTFKKYTDLKKDEADICLYHGRKKAVYCDNLGNYHIIKPYCSHLKCQLKFNYNSRLWECPCHGSSFSIDGEVVTSPANKSLGNQNKL